MSITWRTRCVSAPKSDHSTRETRNPRAGARRRVMERATSSRSRGVARTRRWSKSHGSALSPLRRATVTRSLELSGAGSTATTSRLATSASSAVAASAKASDSATWAQSCLAFLPARDGSDPLRVKRGSSPSPGPTSPQRDRKMRFDGRRMVKIETFVAGRPIKSDLDSREGEDPPLVNRTRLSGLWFASRFGHPRGAWLDFARRPV